MREQQSDQRIYCLDLPMVHHVGYLLNFVWLITLWTTLGCESRPRSIDQYIQAGETINGDHAIEVDMQLTETRLDAAIELDLGLMDMSSLPDMNDIEVTVERLAMPLNEERAYVENAESIFVIWRFENYIYRSVIDKQELSIDNDTGPLSHSQWFKLPEQFLGQEVDIHTVMGSPPIFIISSGSLEAFSIRGDEENVTLQPLGLQGPILSAEGDGGALIMGQLWEEPAPNTDVEMSNDESTLQKIAWRFVREGVWSPLQQDELGIPPVSSVSKGLGGWVLATAAHQCFRLTERIGIIDSWYCHSMDRSIVLGDHFGLLIIGEQLHSMENEPLTSGIWAWSGTPGHSTPFTDTIGYRASEYDQNVLSDGDSILLRNGRLFRTVNLGHLPQFFVEDEDDQNYILTLRGEYTLNQRLTDHVFGLVLLNNERPAQLLWDESNGWLTMTWVDVNHWHSFTLPSAEPEDEFCIATPERCDEIDHDCDGNSHNQRCCLNGESVSSRLQEVLFPQLEWFTGDSEIGALVAIASQNSARLFSFPTSGGEATLRAQWPSIEYLTQFSNYLSLVSIAAMNEAGDYVLLQNRRIDDQWFQFTLPCEPLALTVLDAAHKTRIYCDRQIFVYSTADETLSEESLPEEGQIKWMTRWLTGVETLGQTYWLVAMGESYQLSLWRDDLDQVSLGESETIYLPNQLGSLVARDRSIAIQLPSFGQGLLSRVIDHQLEVWIDPLGWTMLGGHRYPFWAKISSQIPAAVSVGFSEDPQDIQDSFLQRVDIRVHPLLDQSVLFGEVTKERVSRDSFGGAQFAQYDAQNGARPNFISLIAGSLELSSIDCQN